MIRRRTATILILPILLAILPACFPSIGGISGGTATPRQIKFTGPVTTRIISGESLPGTNIQYLGRTPDDRANVIIGGLAAPKKGGDSLNWSGSPVPFTLVNLRTRVLTYDDGALNLVGTVDVIIQDPKPQPAQSPSSSYVMEFTLPAHHNLVRNQSVPGTTLAYVGKKTEGAQFSGIEGYPYRQQLDSVLWSGFLRDKVFIKADLRVTFYNDTNADLLGTMMIRFEQ